MKKNTKSSITLPKDEALLVDNLKKRLGVKTRVEVIRQCLSLMKEKTDRDLLRQQYHEASLAVREASALEVAELDQLASEGLTD